MDIINNITIIGRLTKDVELSYTANNNTPVAKFSIAHNLGTGNNEKVNFFDIVAWKKNAENCNQFLKKGSQVIIVGRLQQDRFQDKTGQNRSKIQIIANNVQFVGGRSDNTGEEKQRFSSPPERQRSSPPSGDPFDSIDFSNDEEIPF